MNASLEDVIRWAVGQGLKRTGRGNLALPVIAKNVVRDDGEMDVTIATDAIDRHGDIVEAAGADLTAYRKNPVVMWAHDYTNLPIGLAKNIRREGDSIKASVQWAPTAFAGQVAELYRRGYLRAWSIGFRPIEWEERTESTNGKEEFAGYRFTKWELLEFSGVPIPANPEALTSALRDGVVTHKSLIKSLGLRRVAKPILLTKLDADVDDNDNEQEVSGAIPYRQTPKDPESAPWDGPKEVAEAAIHDLKVMCAWYDAGNPEAKQSYKLPHHRASNHHLVWHGLAAAMGALLGARGGVAIPDEDRAKVYDHLTRHHREFGKEPPELPKAPESRHELARLIEPIPAQKDGRFIDWSTLQTLAAARDALAESIDAQQHAIAALDELMDPAEVKSEEGRGFSSLTRRLGCHTGTASGKQETKTEPGSSAASGREDLSSEASAKEEGSQQRVVGRVVTAHRTQSSAKPAVLSDESIRELSIRVGKEFRKTIPETIGVLVGKALDRRRGRV